MSLSNFFSFFSKIEILEFDPISLQKRDFCISKRKFDKLVGINGLPNFIIDKDTGRPCYLAKKITWTKEKKEIDWGWVHTPDCSPFILLCFREHYDKFLKDYRDSKIRVVELSDMPFVEGMDIGIRCVQKNIDLMKAIVFGKLNISESLGSADDTDSDEVLQ